MKLDYVSYSVEFDKDSLTDLKVGDTVDVTTEEGSCKYALCIGYCRKCAFIEKDVCIHAICANSPIEIQEKSRRAGEHVILMGIEDVLYGL
jgi:hypothetical protein